MKHFASPKFWQCYKGLPKNIRDLADKNFELLKADPKYPSLHFKQSIFEHLALIKKRGLFGFGSALMLTTIS